MTFKAPKWLYTSSQAGALHDALAFSECHYFVLYIYLSSLQISGQYEVNQVPRGQEMLATKKHKARLQLQTQPHLEVSVHASKYLWASFVDGTVFRVITVVSAFPQPQTQ